VSLFDLGSGDGPHIRSQQLAILSNEQPSERHAIALIVECGIDVRLAGVGEAMVPP
jgi:hypothetical protein